MNSNTKNLNPDENEDGFFICPEGCGRKFTRLALIRHKKICKAVFLSQKDPVDMSAKRKLKESKDLEKRRNLQQQEVDFIKQRIELLKKEKESIKAEKEKPENFPRWKKQSEALRAVMKDNRGNSRKYDAEFIIEGLNKAKYIKCDGCGRNFNELASERHIAKFLRNSMLLNYIRKK